MSQVITAKNALFTSFLLIVLISFNSTADARQSAQNFDFNTGDMYRITLNDGSEIIGKFMSRTEDTIILSTSSLPKVEIPVSSIKKIAVIDSESIREDGSYWFPNPNATRYFFGPSSYNLNKEEGYYQNAYLFLNSVNYGLTDNFSVGGGFELLSTFSPDVTPIFFLTPKISTDLAEKARIGAGIFIANVDGYMVGITYGTATYGNRDDNLTLALGWGFLDGEFASQPVFTLSGMTRLQRKFSLVTENWFVPDGDGYYGILSYGGRFFGEKLAVDLGFLNNPDIAQAVVIGVPYVGFVVGF